MLDELDGVVVACKVFCVEGREIVHARCNIKVTCVWQSGGVSALSSRPALP